MEISLTVIAAILTLIGYSNNDTIVVFDRIRENLKLMRREKLSDIVNRSINQTLSRTILTAGLTFLTVLGSVLVRRGSAAWLLLRTGDRHPDRDLFVDCHCGAILVAYQDWRGRGKRPVIGAAGQKRSAAKRLVRPQQSRRRVREPRSRDSAWIMAVCRRCLS